MKTILTRPRSTSYRGRIAIHAAKRRPDHDHPVGDWHPAPLGAVVASAVLTDCVKVYPFGRCPTEPGVYIEDTRREHWGGPDPGGLWLCQLRVDGGIDSLDRIEEQRPFGDFSPGRYALLLDDVRPVDPIPCKGASGLWTLPEEVARAVMG